MHLIRICLVVLALAGVAASQTKQTRPDSPLLAQHSPASVDENEHLAHPNWLGPFVATPAPVVNAALELAKVGKNDLVYDLGSGDGRIILAAAQKFQAMSVGIEWDQALCEKTSAEIERLGLEDKVRVIQGDIFNQDVSAATVVTGYLLPKSLERLAPILERQLKSGVRVVTVNYPVPGWRVVDEKQLMGESKTTSWSLYLYQIE
jgi:SAM-dependent methyltransferase